MAGDISSHHSECFGGVGGGVTGSQSRFGDGWRDETGEGPAGEIAKERGGGSAILEAEDTEAEVEAETETEGGWWWMVVEEWGGVGRSGEEWRRRETVEWWRREMVEDSKEAPRGRRPSRRGGSGAWRR